VAVCYFEQNVGMAGLIERTPTGEILPAQSQLYVCWCVSKISLHDIFSIGSNAFGGCPSS